MRWKISFLFAVAMIFCLAFVSSYYAVSDFYVQQNYQSGEKISGWVEVSFVNQSINSTLEDSFGNRINLSAFLDFNPAYNYTLDNSTNEVNSFLQRIYFDNASLRLPTGNIPNTKYNINLSGEVLVESNITISNAGDLIKTELASKRSKLNNLTLSLNSYPLFMQTEIKKSIDVSGLDSNLTNIGLLYNSSSESSYPELLNALNEIIIPESVYEAKTADSVSFTSNKNNIDLEFLKSIGGGNYDLSNEDGYKNAILFWNQENLMPKVTFKEINVNYGVLGDQPLIDYVEVNVNQKPSSQVFLIINEIESISFQSDYNEVRDGGYIYIDMSQAGERIAFTTTESLDLSNLPVFIAPSLNLISINDSTSGIINSDTESKVSKWVLFSLIIMFLIIVFIVSYLLTKAWYDKKYENYLFKNKNNLYNLVVYIHNAKRKGINNDEIERNLRKAKWTNEQVRYIMRKYAGKRTGLWAPFSKDIKDKIKDTKFNKP